MTISKGLVDNRLEQYILAALIGVIIWNLITWYLEFQAAHALIGGLLGATIVFTSSTTYRLDRVLEKVVIPLFTFLDRISCRFLFDDYHI